MIKNKLKIMIFTILIIVIGVILLLMIYSDLFDSSLEKNDEWFNFRKLIKENNQFVNRVSLGSTRSHNITITCFLNREIDTVEAENLFREITSFILSEDEFQYLKTEYIKIYNNEFAHIYIKFDSNRKDDVSDYQFYSDDIGVSLSDSFKTWQLNIKGKYFKSINIVK